MSSGNEQANPGISTEEKRMFFLIRDPIRKETNSYFSG